MRLAALLLLLANVAFLAWARYAPASPSEEPQLIAQQIRPEAIRLLSEREVAALRKTDSASLACVEWGAFNASDVTRARAALAPIAPAAAVSERQVQEAAGWWVYVPPQPSRQSVNQKVAELKELGIEEYFIVQEDAKLRFAVSLGVYRTEEAARARLEQLRARGVHTAVVGARPTPVRKAYLQLRELPEGVQPKLAELRDAFPGTDMKSCAS
jgi:hypothetical protein